MTEISSATIIPLFPLNTVLFPEGMLALRIFEPRYLSMVSACMKNASGFGVCLIREGAEADSSSLIHRVGTLAKIVDWQMNPDGLLGIMAQGQQRFTVLAEHTEANQLRVATVEMIPAAAPTEVPACYLPMVELLRQTIERHPQSEGIKKYTDADWVGARLVELLPLKLTLKQDFLQLHNPIQRLDRLHAILEQLDIG